MDCESYSKKHDDTEEVFSDFPSMGVDLIKKINFKVAFFLFITSILIFSDIFIYNILPKSYVDGDCPNTNGVMVQITVLILAYIICKLQLK